MKKLVKVGPTAVLDTNGKPMLMTREQAKRWGDRQMPSDVRRARFVTQVTDSDPELHGGDWFRVSYGFREAGRS